MTYRGNKILRLDEYHDAAKMAAFWRLVTSEANAEEPHPLDDNTRVSLIGPGAV